MYIKLYIKYYVYKIIYELLCTIIYMIVGWYSNEGIGASLAFVSDYMHSVSISNLSHE